MEDRYHGYATRRYGATQAGHDVELEFDKKLMVLNRARLSLDGQAIDAARIFYGEKHLKATADDGTLFEVAVDSGMLGELTKAQIRQENGTWADLEEREPRT